MRNHVDGALFPCRTRLCNRKMCPENSWVVSWMWQQLIRIQRRLLWACKWMARTAYSIGSCQKWWVLDTRRKKPVWRGGGLKTLNVRRHWECELLADGDLSTLSRSFMLISTAPSVFRPSKSSRNKNHISTLNGAWPLSAKGSGGSWMSAYNFNLHLAPNG